MIKYNKTILAVLLQWDYGKPERGISAEKLWFYDNLVTLAEKVEVFWYDEYLQDLPLLQQCLLQKAAAVDPDLIFFIPFQDQFSFEALDLLKASSTTLAWFGDDTWRFDSFSSRYAPHFSYVATTDPFSLAKYRKLGAQPILTEWAAQPFSDRTGPLHEAESYEFEVSFVGGHSSYRAWLIGKLAQKGVQVACFGAGWPNGRVSFERMEQIFRKSRINLNISNSVNRDIRFVLGSPRNLASYLVCSKRSEQVKARNFEIPLAGGFQLSNYVLGLERHLAIGKETAIYTTPEECAELIGYYLENEDLRMDLLIRGHERTKNEHTYQHRLSHILGSIWD